MVVFNEAEILRRCRDGDQEAFRELVEQYENLVFGLIARTIRRRDRAEDLAQEVFVRVYRGLPYFRGEARLSTWIYRIVTNVCLQDAAASRPPDTSLDDEPREGARRREPGAQDAAFGTLELRDRLDKAMASLPPQYRLLLAAHYLKGLRYEEIAAAHGVPIGTVKTQIHRAKRQLRSWLEADASGRDRRAGHEER